MQNLYTTYIMRGRTRHGVGVFLTAVERPQTSILNFGRCYLQSTAMFWTLLITLLCAATATPLAVSSAHTSISRANLTEDHVSIADIYSSRNVTLYSLTFLGVDCYNLLPDTVSIIACQPLFARLVARGRVYEKVRLYDGYRFQAGYDPCVIKIENPDREERRHPIRISMAQMISYATEVLETCRNPGCGGSNNFDGSWRIVVTRKGLRSSVYQQSSKDTD